MIAMLVLLSAARADLVNGDFETGDLTGWQSYGFTAEASATAPHAGSWAGALGLDPSDAEFQESGFYQDVATSEGESLEASGWIAVTTDLDAGAYATLKIEFYTDDAVFVDESDLEVLSGPVTTGDYARYAVDATTPTRATVARYVLTLDGDPGPGALSLDDAALGAPMVDTGDTGDTSTHDTAADKAGNSGCGCAVSPSSGLGPLGLIAVALGIARRPRRYTGQ